MVVGTIRDPWLIMKMGSQAAPRRVEIKGYVFVKYAFLQINIGNARQGGSPETTTQGPCPAPPHTTCQALLLSRKEAGDAKLR